MLKFDKNFFLILSCIVLLVWAASSFAFLKKEQRTRVFVEKQLALTVEEKNKTEALLDFERTEKKIVQQELIKEKNQVLSLEEQMQEKEKETQMALDRMEEKEKTITELLAKLEEEGQRRFKLEEQLKRSENQLFSLKRRNRPGKKEPFSPVVTLDTIEIRSSPADIKEGKILLVNQELNFLVTDLGVSEVRIGDPVSILRGNEQIAQGQVERVEQNTSAVKILPPYQQVEINETDKVKLQ